MGVLDFLKKDDYYDDDELYDDEMGRDYDDEYGDYEDEQTSVVSHTPNVCNVDQLDVTVVLSAPTDIADCTIIIDNLKKNNVISLSLERTDEQMSQRIIDLLSGAAYAISASVKQVSIDNDKSYLITPGAVKVDDSLMKNINKGTRDILSKAKYN